MDSVHELLKKSKELPWKCVKSIWDFLVARQTDARELFGAILEAKNIHDLKCEKVVVESIVHSLGLKKYWGLKVTCTNEKGKETIFLYAHRDVFRFWNQYVPYSLFELQEVSKGDKILKDGEIRKGWTFDAAKCALERLVLLMGWASATYEFIKNTPKRIASCIEQALELTVSAAKTAGQTVLDAAGHIVNKGKEVKSAIEHLIEMVLFKAIQTFGGEPGSAIEEAEVDNPGKGIYEATLWECLMNTMHDWTTLLIATMKIHWRRFINFILDYLLSVALLGFAISALSLGLKSVVGSAAACNIM
mmetsp:Transcript_42391/g.109074  ORF Transcript_42391/g.109074 Transcript_42391/m.109074 type:complete len:304 (-) Transcript_42391:28-939(-)